MSKQLQSIFPDVDQIIKHEFETFKEKIYDLDKLIEKVSNIDDDQDDQDEQKIIDFEFFTGRFNQNLILLFVNLGFPQKIKNLSAFYDGICVKKY